MCGAARNLVEVEGQTAEGPASTDANPTPRLPLPFSAQLTALASLLTQLELKVRRIPGGTAEEDRRLAGLHASDSAAHMALSYRAAQKEIAVLGIQALQREIKELLHIASSAAVKAGLLSCPPKQTEGIAERCKASQVLPPPQAENSDLAIIVDSWERGQDIQGWRLGVCTSEAVASGDGLAKLQASEVVTAPDKDALKVQLLQQALLQGSEAPPSYGAAMQMCLQGIAPRPTINLQLLSGLQGFEELEYLQSCQREAGRQLRSVAAPQLPGLDQLPPKRQLLLCCWADQAVERCALPCPQGVAIVPIASVVPQEFMGSVVEARWEESGAWVEVVARVPLEAGTQLSEGLLLLGRSSASVLTTHGLQALHCLQAAQAGGEPLPLELGGSLLKDSYEISVSPTEEDPEFLLKQELLVCSSLGFTHHIAASVRLEYLLAAFAVILATASQLRKAGCQELLEAYRKVQEAGPPLETVAGLRGVAQEETPQDRLAACQQSFISGMLADGAAIKAAKKQVKALLLAAREEVSKGKYGKSLSEEHKNALKQYRADMKIILKTAVVELSKKGKRDAGAS